MAQKEKAKGGMKKELFVLSPKQNGQGPLQFAWHPDGLFLAVAGSNKVVHIFDRGGEVIQELPLTSGLCTGIDWDKDGELLAFIQQGGASVTLWNKNSRKATTIDNPTKDVITFISWSKTGPQLAMGTAKGVIIIFNKKTQKSVPITGKHAKKIIGGAWNTKNYIAFASEDRIVTVFNSEGEIQDQTTVNTEPSDIMV